MAGPLASQRKRRRIGQALVYAFLSAAAAVVLFPYVWMLLTSLKPIEEFFSYPLRWLTPNWTFRQYQAVLSDPRFLASVRNSLAVSVMVTAVSLALSIPAAYGLTRLRAPGGRAVLVTIVSSQFFPPMIFFIPFYIILSHFKLLNTLTGLVFAYLSVTLPICTWMIANTFRGIPRELEEAAKVDGCGDVRTIVEILLRISAPGIITAGLFAFVLAWQEYIFALLYTTTPAAQTAPVILFYFLGQHQIDYGRLMAGAVLLSLPIVVPFACLQRYFRQGRMEGGVKG
jgi:ABC-type glycerol-3-phosphate transport system permease component